MNIFSDLSEKFSSMYNKAKTKVMSMSAPATTQVNQERPMEGGSRKRRPRSIKYKRKSNSNKRKKTKRVRFSKKNKIYTISRRK
jgi:hypothetical protein